MFWREEVNVPAKSTHRKGGPAAIYLYLPNDFFNLLQNFVRRASRLCRPSKEGRASAHHPSWAGIDGIKFDGRDARRRIGIVRNIISKPTLEICVVSTRSREEEIGEGRWGHFFAIVRLRNEIVVLKMPSRGVEV